MKRVNNSRMGTYLNKLKASAVQTPAVEHNKKIYQIFDTLLDDYNSKKVNKTKTIKMCSHLHKYLKITG